MLLMSQSVPHPIIHTMNKDNGNDDKHCIGWASQRFLICGGISLHRKRESREDIGSAIVGSRIIAIIGSAPSSVACV